MQDHFFTILEQSEGFYKEKGSKFLAFAFAVSSEEEIKEKLAGLRKEYYDARHHCYAYIHGNEGQHVRANDDGEPNHSAGDPILGQIRSKDLTNTLVVVVRYFGGTKLGVSGLINAYKTAASEALDNNKIIECQITESFKLTFPFKETNEIMKLVKKLNLNLKSKSFENECQFIIDININQVKLFQVRIQLLIDLGHSIKLRKITSEN